MSYDTVLRFKIDRKNLSITTKSRDSNSYDWNGRRTVSTYTQKYNSQDEFKNAIFNFADGYLGGSIRFNKSSTFAKRVIYLQQNNLLTIDEKTDYCTWYKVQRTEKVYQILSGIKHVKPVVYVITNDNNTIGYKSTPRYDKLAESRFTKFYDLDSAKQAFENCQSLDWVDRYNLSIKQA